MRVVLDAGIRAGASIDWLSFNRTLYLFQSLKNRYRLEIQPCLEQDVLPALRGTQGLGSVKAVIERSLIGLIHREELAPCGATVQAGPADLSDVWTESLWNALASSEDWRAPQILICAERSSVWPHEPLIDISAEACMEKAAINQRSVPLVRMEEYAEHRYALSDQDPWDLRSSHPAQSRGQHPCLLPKPSSCQQVAVAVLQATLGNCSPQENGRRCYIPPETWNPADIAREDRRRGFVLPRSRIGQHHGFLDREGFVWEWDLLETHWDVQCHDGSYQRASHTGATLD